MMHCCWVTLGGRRWCWAACWVVLGCTMMGAMTKAIMFGFETGQEMAMTLILNGLFFVKCHAFMGAFKDKIKHVNHEGPSIQVFISIHAVQNMYCNRYLPSTIMNISPPPPPPKKGPLASPIH